MSSAKRAPVPAAVIFVRVEHLAELESAQLRRLPFAVVDFDPGPSISSVRVDARAGCYAAAKHLIEHGHRRFGILSFLRSSGSARIHTPGQR
jgi:DNA-binding LacI/PurR family transcriptional regulator